MPATLTPAKPTVPPSATSTKLPTRARPAYRTEVHPGMGAIPHKAGVAFRVWAPHAESVAVQFRDALGQGRTGFGE